MSITWIIILSLFGLIVLIIALRVLFSFFMKKDKTAKGEKTPKKIDQFEEEFQINFIKLGAILDANEELQKLQTTKISKLNNYMKDNLMVLTQQPVYVFNLHLAAMNEYVDEFVQTKLLKNSASIWTKLFAEEVLFLRFKIKEFEEKNNDLKFLHQQIETEILKGWTNGKNEL